MPTNSTLLDTEPPVSFELTASALQERRSTPNELRWRRTARCFVELGFPLCSSCDNQEYLEPGLA